MWTLGIPLRSVVPNLCCLMGHVNRAWPIYGMDLADSPNPAASGAGTAWPHLAMRSEAGVEQTHGEKGFDLAPLWGKGAWPGPNPALQGGERRFDTAPIWPHSEEVGIVQPQHSCVEGRESHSASTHSMGIGNGNLAVGESGHINCHRSLTTKFPNPWGVPWARCCGSTDCIWPRGWKLSTPTLDCTFDMRQGGLLDWGHGWEPGITSPITDSRVIGEIIGDLVGKGLLPQVTCLLLWLSRVTDWVSSSEAMLS